MTSNFRKLTLLAALAYAAAFEPAPARAQLPPDANTTCPVMTEEATDPDMYVEHNGRKIYVCCAKCKREFRANPEKYLALLDGGASGAARNATADNSMSTASRASATTATAAMIPVGANVSPADRAATRAVTRGQGTQISAIAALIGRLHPLTVHLPIGIAIGAALLETAALMRRRPTASDASRILNGLAAVAAVPAAAFGWLNAAASRHPGLESIVEWHRWLGVAAVALLALVWALSHRAAANERSWRAPYLAALYVSVALLAVAGHFGGMLVYGPDYLTLRE